MSTLTAPVLDAPPLRRYGFPELVLATSPAAGAHFTQEISSGLAARLLSVHVRLVCSATVADRQLVLEYRDGNDNRFALFGTSQVQQASGTADYVFQAFQPELVATVDASVLIPLAPILLYPSWDFRIYVAAIDSTDQLSRIRFMWERFYLSEPSGGIA